MIEQLTFNELARRYCERQESTPEVLRETLLAQKERFKPDGWILIQCVVLDSSRLGDFVILPYGGEATLKEIPPEGKLFSPRGLCSDLSETVAFVPSTDLT